MHPPPAFGADRVAVAADGTIVLTSRFDKGWRPPQDNGLVHARFPGTCVRWNDAMWEVVAAEALPVGVRYALQPWDESNIIRGGAEDYDEAGERRRRETREAEKKRESFRKVSIPLALLLGNLPGPVQERIGSETGVLATRMTLIALAPLAVYGGFSLIFLGASVAGAPPPVPGWVLLPGVYFFAESMIRFTLVFTNDKPVGSLVTVVPYKVREAFVTGWTRKPPRVRSAPEPSVAERDAYALREPLLALLPAGEQLVLRDRFGFDPIRWGRRTALLIFVFAAAGVWTASRSLAAGGGVVAFAVAAYAAAEQVARLMRLASNRPAGSAFGFLLRPFLAPLLRRHPPV